MSVIVNFIDQNSKGIEVKMMEESKFNSSPLYKELQSKIAEMLNFKGKEPTLSARKVINLYVKIGFVQPFLAGYHPLVKKFLLAANDEQKRIIYSKIFYENSSLASGTTVDNSDLKHISFFLQTLDYNGKLTEDDLTALMVTDITRYRNGYLTREQLNEQFRFAKVNDFENRKYNQIAHLIAYLKNFIDLKYDKETGVFWFADNPNVVDKEYDNKYPRNNIKHRIYKKELEEESKKVFGDVVCFFEKKPYKGLIASHIKPYAQCMKEGREDQAYDPNNGLLINQNLDAYFDKFDITFTNEGDIVFGKMVPESIKEDLKNWLYLN